MHINMRDMFYLLLFFFTRYLSLSVYASNLFFICRVECVVSIFHQDTHPKKKKKYWKKNQTQPNTTNTVKYFICDTSYTQLSLLSFMYGVGFFLYHVNSVFRVTKPYKKLCTQSIQWHGVTFVNIYLTINQTWMQKHQIIGSCVCACVRACAKRVILSCWFFFSFHRMHEYFIYIKIHWTMQTSVAAGSFKGRYHLLKINFMWKWMREKKKAEWNMANKCDLKFKNTHYKVHYETWIIIHWMCFSLGALQIAIHLYKLF